MDEPTVVSAQDIISEFGRDVYELMPSYRLHHLDDRSRPFWTSDVAASLLELIEPELRDVDDGR
jgi:hypothetical protein